MKKHIIIDFFKLLFVFFVIGMSLNSNPVKASFLYENFYDDIKPVVEDTECY